MSICTSSSSSSTAKAWIVHGLAVEATITVAIGACAYVYLIHPAKFRSRVIGIIPAHMASSREIDKIKNDFYGVTKD
ncbi:hypothetical protein LguiB_031008 [Lonicera macranthoides]